MPSRVRSSCIPTVLGFVLAAAGQAQDPSPVAIRPDPPSADERDAARRSIRGSADDLAGTAFEQAGSALQKQKLGEQLLVQAQAMTPSARHYVLFDEARLLAVAAGDIAVAFGCVSTLAATYRIDELQLSADTLDALSDTFCARERRLEIAMRRLALLRRLAAAGRTGLVLEQTRAATSSRLANGNMPRSYDELERSELARAFRGVAAARVADSARQALQSNANDAVANGKLGAYLCFATNRWSSGLPCLARGDDPELARVAALDLRGAEDDVGRQAIAEAWWGVAAQHPDRQRAARLRAANWYARMSVRDGVGAPNAAERVAEVRSELRDHVHELGLAVAGDASTLLQQTVVALHVERYPDLFAEPIATTILAECAPDTEGAPGEPWGEVVIRDATLSDAQRQEVAKQMAALLDENIPGALADGDVIILNVAGMWVADLSERARASARIPIRKEVEGTVVLSTEDGIGRMTTTGQTPPVGAVLWMAGRTRVGSLREFATEFLATAEQVRRGRNTVRIVYTYPVRNATMTDHLTFTRPVVDGIRQTLRRLEWLDEPKK